MKIQFIVDTGEFEEPEIVDLPDDIAKQHLRANHVVKVKTDKKDTTKKAETKKAETKKDKSEK